MKTFVQQIKNEQSSGEKTHFFYKFDAHEPTRYVRTLRTTLGPGPSHMFTSLRFLSFIAK